MLPSDMLMDIHKKDRSEFLEGELLIAMPGIKESSLEQAVVYICHHSKHGSLGMVINQRMTEIDADTLLNFIGGGETLKEKAPHVHIPVFSGGPTDKHKGFILHDAGFMSDNALMSNEKANIAVSSNLDILKHMLNGEGEYRSILTLGYVSWEPGELEKELRHNDWMMLSAEGHSDLVFSNHTETKWGSALHALGIHDPVMLASHPGNG